MSSRPMTDTPPGYARKANPPVIFPFTDVALRAARGVSPQARQQLKALMTQGIPYPGLFDALERLLQR